MADTALTVADVAERLKLSADSVLALIRSGKLCASNVGLGTHRPRWRVTSEALGQFLAAQVAPKRLTKRSRKRSVAVIEFF